MWIDTTQLEHFYAGSFGLLAKQVVNPIFLSCGPQPNATSLLGLGIDILILDFFMAK